MHLSRRLLTALAIAAIAGTALTAAVATAQPGALRVEQVRFVKATFDGDNLTLDAVLYLTSIGGGSRDVRLVAYTYPKATGIADERQEVHVGRVASQRTSEVRVTLHIPGFDPRSSAGWTVDFLIFEDDLLTQQGHGTIGYRGELLHPARLVAEDLDASAGPFEAVR